MFRKIMVTAGNEHARFMLNIRASLLPADYTRGRKRDRKTRIGREIIMWIHAAYATLLHGVFQMRESSGAMLYFTPHE